MVPLIGCPAQSDSKTKAGWTLGWGSEFGLTPNVSVNSETMYFDLGTVRYNMTFSGTDSFRRWGFAFTSVGDQLQERLQLRDEIRVAGRDPWRSPKFAIRSPPLSQIRFKPCSG
jgi:hypothetical protein